MSAESDLNKIDSVPMRRHTVRFEKFEGKAVFDFMEAVSERGSCFGQGTAGCQHN